MDPTRLDIPRQLDTERLWLRAPRPEDWQMIHEAVQDSLDNLRQWMAWAVNGQTAEQTRQVTREMAARFEQRESLTYRLIRRSDQRLVGGASVFNFVWEVPRCEIGYWLRTDAQGHGYMTEAVNRLTEFAFANLGMQRVEIFCDARNRRSAAVAERAGYTLEAQLRHHRRATDGTLSDTRIYARLREG